MIKVQIISWRDIPVQVRVKNGRFRHTRQLSTRFQQAVYRAAYRSKAISGDAYQDEWTVSKWQDQEGEVEEVLTAVSTNLETTYSDDRLDRLARNKGYEPHDS